MYLCWTYHNRKSIRCNNTKNLGHIPTQTAITKIKYYKMSVSKTKPRTKCSIRKQYHCDCYKSIVTSSSDVYTRHLYSYHNHQMSGYRCSECLRKFPTITSCLDHFLTKHENLPCPSAQVVHTWYEEGDDELVLCIPSPASSPAPPSPEVEILPTVTPQYSAPTEPQDCFSSNIIEILPQLKETLFWSMLNESQASNLEHQLITGGMWLCPLSSCVYMAPFTQLDDFLAHAKSTVHSVEKIEDAVQYKTEETEILPLPSDVYDS